MAETDPLSTTATTATSTNSQTLSPTPESATYNAVTSDVGESSLVSNQMNGLLSRSSPLMKRAAASGMATANSRGLLNSSVASGTAMGAMADRALPIAQQDAQTHFTQSQTNQAVQNDAAKFNANTGATNFLTTEAEKLKRGTMGEQYGYETEMQKLRGTQTMEQAAQQADLQERLGLSAEELKRGTMQQQYQQEQSMQAAMQAQKAADETNLQKLRGDQSLDLAEVDAKYRSLAQTNASAAEILKTYSASVAQIMSNKDLKATQISASLTALKSGMAAQLDVISAISGIDLSKYAAGFAG